LVLQKITEIVAPRCPIFRLKCTKFDFNFAGELTAVPQTTWLDLRGLHVREGRGGIL